MNDNISNESWLSECREEDERYLAFKCLRLELMRNQALAEERRLRINSGLRD